MFSGGIWRVYDEPGARFWRVLQGCQNPPPPEKLGIHGIHVNFEVIFPQNQPPPESVDIQVEFYNIINTLLATEKLILGNLRCADLSGLIVFAEQ